MDPITIGAMLLGGGTSIVGSIFGGNAQDEANATNRQANLMNYYARQQERNDRIQQAQLARGDAKKADAKNEKRYDDRLKDMRLGSTDAMGNRTKWVDGQGWVVDLSDTSENLRDAEANEQLAQLTRDAPLKRKQQDANYGEQVADRDRAQVLRKKLGEVRVDPEAIRRRSAAEAAKGVNGTFDEATNTAMRSALRTGSSNTGNILAAMAKQRAGAVGDAVSKAGAAAPAQAMALEDAETKQLSNLFNLFAQRASGVNQTQIKASGAAEDANALLARSAQSGNAAQQPQDFYQNERGAISNLLAAFAQQGGTLGKVEPMMGTANTLGAIGSSIESMGNKYGSMRQLANRGDY